MQYLFGGCDSSVQYDTIPNNVIHLCVSAIRLSVMRDVLQSILLEVMRMMYWTDTWMVVCPVLHCHPQDIA